MTLLLMSIEVLLVGVVAVGCGLVGRLIYAAATHPMGGRNPYQRLVLPGLDEDARMNALLNRLADDYEMKLAEGRGAEFSYDDKALLASLASATARRGHARILADAIFQATIVAVTFGAFAIMSKAFFRAITGG